MIDNTVNLIEGIKNKVKMDDLLANTDPLGYFKEQASIKVLDPNDYQGLYQTVLIDTPVGPYFLRFLEEQIGDIGENVTMSDIQSTFKELKPEFIRTSLKKWWLEDFYIFCKDLNPISAEMMTDLLKFEADTITLQVIYNSLGNKEFAQLSDIDSKRKNLCPKMGYLYPDYTDHLIKTRSLEALREELKGQTLY